MEVVRFHDAREFRERADPLLLEHEPANNLILGVSSNVIEHPDRFEAFRGWVVIEGSEPTAAAMQTVPYNLILAIPKSARAIEFLAGEVVEIPGVIGCKPGVDTFVSARTENHRVTMTQGVFELDTVTFPEPVEGLSRMGTADEVDVLAEMWIAFEEEAIGNVEDAERTRAGIERRTEVKSARHGVWVHEVAGRIVSLSGHSGPTPNGIRIGPVYTPPELRGKGYASQLVATQSQWLLDNGHSYCFLYTDLTNPTSNSIYRRIGYRQIAESTQYEFSPRT